MEALLSAFAERSEEGDVLQSVAVIIDITERKRAEEALRENESFLQSVIDEMPANVWVKDADRRFLLVNRSMAQWLGAKPADVIGKTADQCGMCKPSFIGASISRSSIRARRCPPSKRMERFRRRPYMARDQGPIKWSAPLRVDRLHVWN